MAKILVVVDMQNDFITGTLGTPEAQAIVPDVTKRIVEADEDTLVIFTLDSHKRNYLDTEEGKWLPIPHCILRTDGYALNKEMSNTVKNANRIGNNHVCMVHKSTFGNDWTNYFSSLKAMEDFDFDFDNVTEIEIIGLDTDFCVIANAFGLKTIYPNVPITINSKCCAGSTPEWHKKALEMLEHCHFHVI